MILISSKDAVDMLATCAPRAWCKRLLNWEVFWGELRLYARDGTIVHCRPAYDLLREAGWISAPNDVVSDAQLSEIGDLSDDDDGEALKRALAAPRFDQVEWLTYQWGVADGALPIGLIVSQDRLDWEEGNLSASIHYGLVPSEWLESAEEIFEPREASEIRVELTGLSFELSALEMLAPTAQVPNGRAEQTRTGPKLGGRPKKWDWEGALAAVAAEANRNPDGLPQGYGAQAQIEKMISEWFVSRIGEGPVESEVRLRAGRILREIEGRKV
nr:hypothetical protein [uncultured Sphingomonas sp.]